MDILLARAYTQWVYDKSTWHFALVGSSFQIGESSISKIAGDIIDFYILLCEEVVYASLEWKNPPNEIIHLRVDLISQHLESDVIGESGNYAIRLAKFVPSNLLTRSA